LDDVRCLPTTKSAASGFFWRFSVLAGLGPETPTRSRGPAQRRFNRTLWWTLRRPASPTQLSRFRPGPSGPANRTSTHGTGRGKRFRFPECAVHPTSNGDAEVFASSCADIGFDPSSPLSLNITLEVKRFRPQTVNRRRRGGGRRKTCWRYFPTFTTDRRDRRTYSSNSGRKPVVQSLSFPLGFTPGVAGIVRVNPMAFFTEW